MQAQDQHEKYMAHLLSREIEKWTEQQVCELNFSVVLGNTIMFLCMHVIETFVLFGLVVRVLDL